jgi:plasmid stabilization system protein ParE
VDFKIRIAQAAIVDFEAVMAWSWTHHPGTTERFAAALLNHIDLLRSFPSMGAPVHRYAGVRRLLHSPLQVYYRVYQDRRVIEILHFWHGSRKSPDL